jgi:phosphohistidine swiveling domain-containing protein
MEIPPSPTSTWILPLASENATLPLAGGKGANLAIMARTGLPVPDGFHLTTLAYQAYVAANNLEVRILAALPPASADPAALESASTSIQALFASSVMSSEVEVDLLAAYACLGRPAVAVRSSATSEDLPEASFAGQQETYLNVVGDAALLQAVKRCWASLWTARAIGYRDHNGIAQSGAALAVIVQQMVESVASGVLFTANPLTGLRSEMVIDATLGLGEALVSGQVEPDHYVVDGRSWQIITRTLGSKNVALYSLPDGGTAAVAQEACQRQALPDDEIRSLAELGRQVAALYGVPQDIEWAWAEGTLYLLQTRPITSLYPLPAGMPPEPLKVLFSFGAAQGMLDPITPLGCDAMRQLFAAGACLFGIRVNRQTQNVAYAAGERIWMNITTPLRNSIGRVVLNGALGFIDPTVQQVVRLLYTDPRLQPGRRRLSVHAAGQVARFMLPLAGNMLCNLLAPNARRRTIVANGERILADTRTRCAAIAGSRQARLAQVSALLPEVMERQLPSAFRLFVSGVAAGMASFNLLNRLSKRLGHVSADKPQSGWDDRVLEITRGLPNNPTTEMDLALWQTALVIRSDARTLELFGHEAASELAARYQRQDLPTATAGAVDRFLAVYGGRGLAEIDLGRPRWLEEPAHIFEMLSGYLQINAADQAPDAVFARSAENAREAIDRLAEATRKSRGGWFKARLVRIAAGRARALLGMRESPKFFVVRLLGIFRQVLFSIGQEYVADGELAQPDDLMYLDISELAALAQGQPQDWTAVIAQRRETNRRERLRKMLPRVLLSNGRAYYDGFLGSADAEHTLAGSPVSPGSAEGRVRVVLDPRQAALLPGEIMVCPGTDPSWTPLFLTAAGLVMEVGGMMTHGAVVAREYGIPAIVGVERATTRLHTGQRIRINGSTGQIVLLAEPGE